MKKFILVLTVITVILCGVGIINVSVGAYGGTLGDLYYIVYDNYVEIDGCDLSATSITIPSIIEGKPVTTIGFRAFIDHTKLKSVTIPDTVTVIEDYAFDGCDGLNKVYITNLEAWLNIDIEGVYANPLQYAKLYLDETVLTHIVVPGTITEIKNNAFAGYSSLTNIVLHSGVTSVGDYAFMNCTSLSGIVLSEGITSIGNYAFYDCENLKSINIPKSLTSIGNYAFWDCMAIENVDIAGLKEWCNIDFSNETSNPLGCCRQLCIDGVLVEDLIIPDGLTQIKPFSFYNCGSLVSVTIPEGVITVGRGAFSLCTNVKTITLPLSLSYIEKYAFECSGLKTVNYAGSEQQWEDISISKGNDYFASADFVYNAGNKTNSIVPNETLTEATVTFANIDLNDDMVIVLASYADGDKFLGFTFKPASDLNLPINNSNGEVKKLKAFLWSSLDLMTPVCESITYEIQ